MSVWPVTLVQHALASGYEESYVDPVVRVSPVFRRKYRLRDIVVIKTYSVSVPITSTDIDTILGFWRYTLEQGTLPFDWVRFDDGTTAHSYLMRGEPTFTATGSDEWRVSLKLVDATPRDIQVDKEPAVVSWPAGAPEYPATEGLKLSFDGLVLRSPYSPVQSSRPRARRVEKSLTITQMMTLSQKRVFESFYEDDTVVGIKPFTHYGFSADGGTETYSFASPPTVSALGGQLFSATFSLVMEH